MLRVGLTGGTANGKSTVMKMLAAKPGVQVMDADLIVRRLYAAGTEVTERIAAAFGREVLAADGSVDRPGLAAIVFSDQSALARLEAIVHPAVVAEEDRWMAEHARNNPDGIVLVEATKLFEAGGGGRYDHVIVVTSRPEVQRQRYCERQASMPPEQAERELARRLASQWTDERRCAQNPRPLVVENSGTREETAAQVDKIYSELLKAARGGETAKS